LSGGRRKGRADKTVVEPKRRSGRGPSARKERRTAAREPAKARTFGQTSPLGTPLESTATTRLARHGPLLFVFAVMVLVALVRLRVAGVPLERDEGEYAYAGQLILQGIPPYQLAYNMKFPGTYYAYSLILALFGQTPWGIHVGLLLVNAATTIVLFFLGRRLLGAFGAAIAATAFAIFSLDRWTMGVFAHATHFVLLPALAGFLILLRPIDSKSVAGFVGAGALLGTAVLMKQQAIFFMPLALGLALWNQNRRPRDLRGMALRGGLVALGGAIPFAILCVLFVAQGVFGRFWFWTFQYAREYVSEVQLSAAWSMFVFGWKSVTRANLPMWLLAAVGVLLLWLVRWTTVARVFLTGLLVASLLAVSPGFYFRQHYFILLLPAAALFVGVAVLSIRRVAERVVPETAAHGIALLLFGLVVSAYAINEEDYLISLPTRDLSRAMYGANPFVEAVDIASYIREKSKPGDRIAVLGSEPEIYFYANRKSATGYIYTYALMEPQRYAPRMQEEMIHEIESVYPAYVVFVTVGTSWLARKSDEKILTWTDQYTRECYDMVGIADIYSFGMSEMRWDAGIAGYAPRSNNVVYTFRRKSDAPCAVAG
jgi:hypothetical protein